MIPVSTSKSTQGWHWGFTPQLRGTAVRATWGRLLPGTAAALWSRGNGGKSRSFGAARAAGGPKFLRGTGTALLSAGAGCLLEKGGSGAG